MVDNPYQAPRTLAEGGKVDEVPNRKDSRVTLVLAVVSPLVAAAMYWGLFSYETWAAPAENGLQERVVLTMLTGTGPFAGPLYTRFQPSRIAATFIVVWLSWPTIITVTRLRHVSYRVHSCLSCMWCFSGLCVASLVIT